MRSYSGMQRIAQGRYYVILLLMTHLREQWQDYSIILRLFAMLQVPTATRATLTTLEPMTTGPDAGRVGGFPV